MSYGLGLSEKRRSVERRNRVLKFFFYLLLLSAAGAYGYFEGQAEADRRVANVEDQVLTLTRENERLNDQARDALNRQSTALAEARSWRNKYESEMPAGELRNILELVRTRMNDGLEAARLQSVIQLIQNSQNCDKKPESKRFIVNTPIFNQVANSISLNDGAVIVTGDGESFLNADGKPEAWFDPAKPVTITFRETGGKSEKITGLLPLEKSMVFGADEYRFTIESGRQSFAKVSAMRCDFP
ncbi:hypothetical protein [Sneathiella chinensis]|uniref:Uncharacterized protein n=1 Tax=Sneathiella chinensis TaxID=349750 RepID=A0ABQ5U100_9PROT|nr:hypothetical protein [Sneathiella chinensis]GLQ05326.1 hypothetical protein GCM10007924_05470 [Sneathiella chinensis]